MTSDPICEEYDRLAPIYDRRWRPYIDVTLHSVMEAVQGEAGESILDVACGTGDLERLLLNRWPALRITGIDLSAGMLERARAKDFGPKVTWLQADATTLKLPEESSTG